MLLTYLSINGNTPTGHYHPLNSQIQLISKSLNFNHTLECYWNWVGIGLACNPRFATLWYKYLFIKMLPVVGGMRAILKGLYGVRFYQKKNWGGDKATFVFWSLLLAFLIRIFYSWKSTSVRSYFFFIIFLKRFRVFFQAIMFSKKKFIKNCPISHTIGIIISSFSIAIDKEKIAPRPTSKGPPKINKKHLRKRTLRKTKRSEKSIKINRAEEQRNKNCAKNFISPREKGEKKQ